MKLMVMFLLLPSIGICEDASIMDFHISNGSTKAVVHFQVSDPVGRRTGLIVGGAQVDEIPGGSYGTDRIDPLEGEEFGVETVSFYLRPILAGSYLLTVTASESTVYDLTALARNKDYVDISPATDTIKVAIAAGAVQRYKFELDPFGAGRISPQPVIDAAAFSPAAVAVCGIGALSGNAGVSGAIRSQGALKLAGNSKVNGDATGAPVSLAGSAEVTGVVSQSTVSWNCTPIDLGLVGQLLGASNDNARIPAGFLSAGALIVDGNKELSLADGSYLVDRVELRGNGALRAGSGVNLFVRRGLTASGNSSIGVLGGIGPVILVDSEETQTISSGMMRATLYAPKAKVRLSGKTRFVGKIQAGSVEMSGDARVEAP